MNFDQYSFFDVDGTMVSIKSMLSFLEFTSGGREGRFFVANKNEVHRFSQMAEKKPSREVLNREYYRVFKGVPYDVFEAAAIEWADLNLGIIDSILVHPVVDRLIEDKRQGRGIVLVTG